MRKIYCYKNGLMRKDKDIAAGLLYTKNEDIYQVGTLGEMHYRHGAIVLPHLRVLTNYKPEKKA